MFERLLLAAALLLAGCGAAISPVPTTQYTKKSSVLPMVLQKKTALKVERKGRVCTLDKGAIAYEVYPSPDGEALAVEKMLMSDLTLLQIYIATPDGCYRPLRPPASTQLWQKVAKKLGVGVDDIDHPRIRFLDWIDAHSYRANLTGVAYAPFDINMTAKFSP